MAVTKRLRFEILRRDNHQCRYCGGALQWDHMTTGPQWPVVLLCERCGRPFQTDVIRALCGACQRAQEVAGLNQPYYQDDSVTLYLGDCLEVTEWLAADVLITDPPYGMKNISRGTYDSTTGITHKPVGAERIASDHNVECRDKALALWGHRPRVVFGTWRHPRPDPVDHRLIWHKQGQAPGPLRAAFMLQDEEIYVTGRGFVESSPPMRTVITTQERRFGRSGQVAVIGHPTPKPVSLMELLITRCPPGVIADPFAGAGATLLAARNQRRQAIGVELEERYCEIAARRLDQMCLDFGTEVGK